MTNRMFDLEFANKELARISERTDTQAVHYREIVDRYKRGMTGAEISREMGIPAITVSRYLRCGCPKSNADRGKWCRITLSNERAQDALAAVEGRADSNAVLFREVIALKQMGLSYREIDERLGNGIDSSNWVNQGVPKPKAKESDVLRLWGLGLSLTQIAQRLGTCTRTIRRRLHACGIRGFQGRS